MSKFRRIVISALTITSISLVSLISVSSHAQGTGNYPNKPVTITVPFGPGGSGDVYARFLAQRLTQELGQPFIVENRPGAGAVIGTQFVAKSAPDGYTLLLMSNTQTVNESLLKHKPYELMRDFTAVAAINEAPLVLVVRQGLDVKTLPELIKRAKSGQGTLNFASSGMGTPYHMAAELFKSAAKIDMVHIPYKSSGGARTDMLGGQVDIMFDAVSTMGDLIGTGKVRAIATTGKTRSNVMPDVPTVAESGMPGFTATVWVGLMAPAATPRPVVDLLNQKVQKILSDPEVVALWAKSGVTPMTGSAADFSQFLTKDMASWKRVVDAANISVE